VSFASTLLRSGALVLVAAVTVVSVGAAGITVRRGVEEGTSLVAGDQAAAMAVMGNSAVDTTVEVAGGIPTSLAVRAEASTLVLVVVARDAGSSSSVPSGFVCSDDNHVCEASCWA